jgi:hypothetical protein
VRSGKIGLDFQRPLEMGDGRINLSAASQGHAQAIVGARQVGLEFQRLLVLGDGRIKLPAAGKRVAKVHAGFDVVGTDCQRLLVLGKCLVNVASRSQGQAIIVVCHIVL